MNFFEQQDLARRNTKRLLLLLVLAVLSLIAITVLLLAALLAWSQGGTETQFNDNQNFSFGAALINALSWEMVIGISLLVSTVVSLGSLYKVMQLRGGGRAVAEAMGGTLLNTHSQDADERKILNVVEEMAIASGTPVPPVYILEDEAINAFAAGQNPQNAVIGITRGCIHLLSRDELQGVVAHEFSHIFHGDMRINIRLVAILHGILLLGLIGGLLVRTTHHRSMFRSSRDKSPGAILALGIGLMVIGYAGTFFGNLIKAAVSRQREFLADASAVQFTRNPDGIAGALKKIGGHIDGSRLAADNAAEYSHMYFSQGVSNAFNSLMATHPPLSERIKRVEPRWDGKFPAVDMRVTDAAQKNQSANQTHAAASSFDGGNSGTAPANSPSGSAELGHAVDHIGQPAAAHLIDAQQKLNAIGEDLRDLAHDPFSARALIFGLLLDANPMLREQQWQLLYREFTADELQNLRKIAEPVVQLQADLRLPLIELALPALKELTQTQYQGFKRCMAVLISADKKISVLEWALQRIVLHHLEPQASIHRRRELRELRNECQLLISVLAYAGAQSNADAQIAFAAAAETLRLAATNILPKSDCKLALLDTALTRLNAVKPLQKPQLLKAMGNCITHDGKVTVAEAELFRAIADGLDCPIPPLVVSEK